jgi:hypothetical protein
MAGDCPQETCPALELAFSLHQPVLSGSAVMLAGFALLALVNVYTWIRYRTSLYTGLLTLGLLLEVAAYVGRILLKNDISNTSYLALYVVGVTSGPTLISTSILLLPAHVMVIYGRDLSLVPQPIYLTVTFLIYNAFTLVFEVVGIVFATRGNSQVEVCPFPQVFRGPFSTKPPSDVISRPTKEHWCLLPAYPCRLVVYWHFMLCIGVFSPGSRTVNTCSTQPMPISTCHQGSRCSSYVSLCPNYCGCRGT